MNTLFDKIWDAHVVQKVEDGPTQLYIDRLYCHEVTSPQAFEGLRARGLRCFRPEKIFCMPDHNTPTHDQDKPIEDPVSRKQVDTLARNAEEFGLTHFGMMNPQERHHPRRRSRTRPDLAGDDHRMRRFPYVDPRSYGCRSLRYRYQ